MRRTASSSRFESQGRRADGEPEQPRQPRPARAISAAMTSAPSAETGDLSAGCLPFVCAPLLVAASRPVVQFVITVLAINRWMELTMLIAWGMVATWILWCLEGCHFGDLSMGQLCGIDRCASCAQPCERRRRAARAYRTQHARMLRKGYRSSGCRGNRKQDRGGGGSDSGRAVPDGQR